MNSEFKIVRQYGLEHADRIVVPKSALGLIQHFAMYLGYDEHGNHYISENIIGKGVVLTRVKDFFAHNTEITRIEKFHGTMRQRRDAIDKALSKLGQPYSLITYNCEHYVNEVWTGKQLSRQVNTAAVLIALLVLIGFIHE